MSPSDSDGTISWRALWLETSDRLGAAHEARWVCEEAAGDRGSDWLARLDEPVGERAVARVDAMVARRLAGEPLQYVLGSWAFRHLDLMVDRRVLIPRPETELVAGLAIEFARDAEHPVVAVDLGTGSGAIGLSLAQELPLDGAEVWLTDRSAAALDVARANLAGIGRHAVNVRIAEGSWFEALPESLAGAVTVVVANPPYIADTDPEVGDEVRAWEPGDALFAGDDGLRDLRTIIGEAPRWLRPGGWLVLEIGHRQGAAVCELVAATAGLEPAEVRLDLAGLDRIVVSRRSGH